MFLSSFYVKNNVNWQLKYEVILFIYDKNFKKTIIPVIEGSAVVKLLWNVSVKVDHWLE